MSANGKFGYADPLELFSGIDGACPLDVGLGFL
jgi:hypothetical protein